MTFCCTTISQSLAQPSSEVPSSANGNKYRDLQLDSMRILSPKQNVSSKSLLSGFREPCEGGGGKTIKSSGDEGHQGIKDF